MKIFDKYKLPLEILNLELVETLDFQDYPILNLLMDQNGHKFLSVILEYNDEKEYRGIIPVSETKFNTFINGGIALDKLYNNSTIKIIFVAIYGESTGEFKSLYGYPTNKFFEYFKIDEEYFYVSRVSDLENKIELMEKLNYARDKRKIIVDLYFRSKELKNDVRIWAFYKILDPAIEIIKSFLDMDTKESYNHFAFSDLRFKSLGASIEIDYEWNLFDENIEKDKMELLANLFNARTKEELQKVVTGTKNEKYIKDYMRILNTIVNKDGNLQTAIIIPHISKIEKTYLDKDNASKIRKIIKEAYPQIIDIEEIKGKFLEIDYTKKEPTFSIQGIDDDSDIIHGKIDPDLIEPIKSDSINFLGSEYIFTIKTIYQPATDFKEETAKHYLIKYVPGNKMVG